MNNEAQVKRTRDGQMGLGLKLRALHMDVDFLVTEFKGAAFYWGAAAHKGFKLHAQDARVEIKAGSFSGCG